MRTSNSRGRWESPRPERDDAGSICLGVGANVLVLSTKPDTEVVRPPIALDHMLAKQRFMSAIGAQRYVPAMFGDGRLEHE
jgi:hypothetical protein